MTNLTLEIPGETLLAMRGDAEVVGARLLLAAAAKLFEIGELSSGAAARLAGIPRTAFLSKIADFGVDTFNLSEEDLANETRLV
jgi:predicted HTH domain antitoxin